MEWEAFLPHVLPDAKGCPDGEAIAAVIKAAREFCRETLVWSYETDQILTGAGVKEYVLQMGDGHDLVRLLNITAGGCNYPVMRGATARAHIRGGTADRIAYMNGPLSFHLHPTPGADGVAIIADVAVMPSLTCAEWPDDLAEFVEHVARGAVSRLCDAEGEDWSSPRTAQSARDEFVGLMNRAKRDVERGYGRARRPYVSSWQ